MDKVFDIYKLRTGMIAVLANGEERQILLGTLDGNMLYTRGRLPIYFNYYTIDLKHTQNRSLDIMKLYITKEGSVEEKLVWTRDGDNTILWSNGETLERNHKMLWHWLAQHPNKHKKDYFIETGIEKPLSQCFACEAAGRTEKYSNTTNCEKCPVVRGTNGGCMDDLFLPWVNATDLRRFYYAERIANLQWKKEALGNEKK